MTWIGGDGIGGGGDVGLDAPTGVVVEGRARRIPVDIIEFDDVLFHADSSVMLPERPGLDATADNAPMTGIKAIGMAFLFAGLYPERGFLITGHTAEQANIPESFRLSRERASVIMYLLEGNAPSWGTTCAGRQTVEDYKHILKYIHEYTGAWKNGDWECDPGDVDNTFNDTTKTALNNFATHFNTDVAAHSDEIADLPVTLGDIIETATDNRFSGAHWRAIYQIYELMICEFLGKTRDELAEMRHNLHWVNDGVKMVGCGHTFALPADERGDEKIRSTTENRVELLIYQASEAESTALTNCATLGTNALHDLENVCPMWYERHFDRNYVGPGDRFAVVYHLKFRYYDRIKKDFQDIPGRMNIKAYERATAAGSASTEIPCITQFQSGMHTVRVRFSEENPDFTNKWIYFSFEAPMGDDGTTPIVRMIHTTGAEETPVVVNRPADAEWNALTFAQKYQYYDLPMKWFSHNWFTRHESTPANDDRFHAHIGAGKRDLKPFGANVTTQSEPLMLSLDDIVLMDHPTGAHQHNQNIQDTNQIAPPLPAPALAAGVPPVTGRPGTPRPLCDGGANPGSRVKVLVVDSTTNQFKLWAKPDDDRTSLNAPLAPAPVRRERIRLERNLISGMAPGAKVIQFRDGFYTVGGRRTTDQPADWMDKTGVQGTYVVGARIALRDDPERHFAVERNLSRSEFGYTGDYELHYFHRLYLEEEHPVSLMIVYLAMNIILSAKGAQARTAWSALAANPGMADISNFVNTGVYNSNDRWNQKHFFYDETTTSDSSLLIKPFYFFDERETFEIPLANAPTGINHRTKAQRNGLFAHAGFVTAKTAAFGGPVKWIIVITPESDSSWAGSFRSNTCAHSIMSLRKSTFETTATSAASNNYSEDGKSYNCFVFAHELGHATSLQDEYVKPETCNLLGDPASYPAFAQHLIQYSMPKNVAAMMFHNGVPRLRHCWYHLHSLNGQIKAAGSVADHPLFGKEFLPKYKTPTRELTFKRHIDWDPSDAAAGGLGAGTGTAKVKADIRNAVVKEENFQLPCWVPVSVAPNLSALVAPLDAKVEADGTNLIWKHNAPMSDAERLILRGIFAADANMDKVDVLRQLSQSVRRLELALYDCAQDESTEGSSLPPENACFHAAQGDYRYHGVLVVRLKIGVFAGTPAMTTANIHAKLASIQLTWDQLGSKFRLVGGAAQMEKVFVHFMPGIEFMGQKVSFNPNLAHAGVTPFRSKVSYHAGSQQLSYCGEMTNAHFQSLITASGLAAGANRTKYINEVSTLYHKTREYHYCLNFIQNCSVSVTVVPTVSPAITALQPKFTHSVPNNTLTWIGASAMTVTERNTLQGAYPLVADQQAMEDLYQKTNLTATDYCPEYPASVTLNQMKAHFLGVEEGTADLASLKFLQGWLNDKLRTDNATPATYTLEAI